MQSWTAEEWAYIEEHILKPLMHEDLVGIYEEQRNKSDDSEDFYQKKYYELLLKVKELEDDMESNMEFCLAMISYYCHVSPYEIAETYNRYRKNVTKQKSTEKEDGGL